MELNANEIQAGDVYTDEVTGNTAEVLRVEVYPSNPSYVRVIFKVNSLVDPDTLILKFMLFSTVDSSVFEAALATPINGVIGMEALVSLGVTLLNTDYWKSVVQVETHGNYTIH